MSLALKEFALDGKTMLLRLFNNSEPVFEFERNFDVSAHKIFLEKYWHWSIYISFVYVALVFIGKAMMENRERFTLQTPLAIWNILLAIFSILGTIRTVGEFVDILMRDDGFHLMLCDSEVYKQQVSGFWMYAFIASKIVEMGDTAFIILRKQKLIFLHWYHHITVFMFCSYGHSIAVSGGRIMEMMNFGIHSLMYSYYAMRAMKLRVPKFASIVLTLLQITQMVIGFGAGVYAGVSESLLGKRCHGYIDGGYYVPLTLALYSSYFVLFVWFFYNSYLVGSPAAGKTTPPAAGRAVLNGATPNGVPVSNGVPHRVRKDQ